MFRKMFISNTREYSVLRAVVASILICFVMVLMAALAANADTGGVPEAGQDAVWEMLDKVVFPIVSAFILSLLSILIHRVSAKYKLDALVTHQDLIEKAALQGISLAEEKAAQYVGTKINGEVKLRIAIEQMRGVIPTITYEQARRVIEGMLARIPGVGATGDKTVTVQ